MLLVHVRWSKTAGPRSGCIRSDQGHGCGCLAQELLGNVSDLPTARRALTVRGNDQQVTGPEGRHDFGRGWSGADLGRDHNVERLKRCCLGIEIRVRFLINSCGLVARVTSALSL